MHPIIRTLLRNRFSAALSILQMTLALAVVLNAMTIFDARITRAFRPTGIDESNLLTVKQAWVTFTDDNGNLDTSPFIPQQFADVAALRNIPGVSDVSVVNSLPLAGWSRNGLLSRTPADKQPKTDVALYYADDSLLRTLRIRITEGRNFLPSEIHEIKLNDPIPAGAIILTKQLARTLFNGASALNQVVYLNGSAAPSTIVGVVDRLETPTRSTWGDSFAYNSVILPTRVATDTTYFAIRTKPGALDYVRSRIADTLYKVSANRVIEDGAIHSFAEMRADAYRSDVAMAWMMIVVSCIFFAITASGVVGLTSFWVRKRQRSIGVRRALGATRRDILIQFLAENATMAGAGACFGAIAAVALNQLLMLHFETTRLSPVWTFIGMLILMLTSLLSALVPSIRASTVAPVVAIRTA